MEKKMLTDDFIEELLDKYDLDELLDIFISEYNLTPREFIDRFMDIVYQMQDDEIDR
jgi:hypothetical protein